MEYTQFNQFSDQELYPVNENESETEVSKPESFDTEEAENGQHKHRAIRSHRFIRTQKELDDQYSRPSPPRPSMKQRLIRCFCCSKGEILKYFTILFPVVSVVKSYKLNYILHDLVSGITVGFLNFPLGIAFGVLASLNPAYGLYSAIFPVILYLIFGTSRHISFGTNGIISLFTREMINSQLQTESNPNATDPNDDVVLKASMASGSACIIGIILLSMGLCRLGFIVSYISSSFVNGFTTAGGVHIVTSQIPAALGIKIPRFTGAGQLILTYKAIFEAVQTINVASLVASLITAIILLVVKDIINVKFKEKLITPIPIDVIVIILATVISYTSNLSDSFGMAVIGDIPIGIPPPRLPSLSLDLILDSCIMAVMIFVLSVSLSRLCEAAHNYRVDNNQELVSYGMANLGSSFFHCMPSCAGPATTITLCLIGPKSSLHGIVSSSFIILIVFCVGPLFKTLPVSVLSTMVIVAVKNLVVQMKELPAIWRLNRYDFFISVGTNLSGCLIDFPYALYVGVVLCIFTVVLQSQNPKTYLLSKLVSEDRFLDTRTYKGLVHHPRVKIFKFESSLYFATAELFRKRLYKLTRDNLDLDVNLGKRKESVIAIEHQDTSRDIECLRRESVQSFTRLPWDGLHDKTLHNKDYVIIDCSSINYIDINGLRILIQVICEMENEGVTIVFASCNKYVKTFFKKSELSSKISEEHIFADVEDAFIALTSE